MEQVAHMLHSPPVSVNSEFPPPSEFFSNGDIQQQLQTPTDGGMMCDDCQLGKRYKTMDWWWDEQCLMNLCEHCGVKKHRSHNLLRHSDAERRESDAYDLFVENTRSRVSEKLADFSREKKFLDSIDSIICDVDRFQTGKQDLIARFELTMQEIEHELMSLGEARLNHATYTQRNIRRESINRVIDAVSTMLHVLQPRLKNLLALFADLKSGAATFPIVEDGNQEEEEEAEEDEETYDAEEEEEFVEEEYAEEEPADENDNNDGDQFNRGDGYANDQDEY